MVIEGASLPIVHRRLRRAQSRIVNGFNLASHTTALKQSVLGKPHLFVLVHQPWTVLQPPSVCGKRSRSSSGASSSLFSSRKSLSADGHKCPFVNCLVGKHHSIRDSLSPACPCIIHDYNPANPPHSSRWSRSLISLAGLARWSLSLVELTRWSRSLVWLLALYS